jgi:predicted phage tail component-like protein
MFTYKGIRSKEMHLRVLNDITFTSPIRDVNVIQVPGRDGDLIMDNGRFESVTRSIPCRLEAPQGANVEVLISRINNWLINDARFHPFTWENDPEFRYLARVEGDVASHRVLSR